MQRQLERLNSLYPSCPTCRLLAPRWPITRPLPSSSRTSPVCSSFSQFCLLVLACYLVKAGITPCNIWPDFTATEKAWKVCWSLHPTPLFQPPKYFLITWQWSRSLWPEWIQTRYSGSLCKQVTLSRLQNCYLVLQTKIHNLIHMYYFFFVQVNTYIEDCIAQKDPLIKILRLVCMQSVCNNGLKQKVLDFYKREILQVQPRFYILHFFKKKLSFSSIRIQIIPQT